MIRPSLLVSSMVLIAVSLGCDSDPTSNGELEPDHLAVELVAEGLDAPVHMTVAPAPAGSADDRLFVVEQTGRIRIVEPDGSVRPAPFLDLSTQVTCCAERGLLSVAFHPDYPSNGYLYVNYTDLNGDTRVERYSVSADPDVADPSSAELVLHVDQPHFNHNGGLNVFGPDGMLYIALGDGQGPANELNHGQDLTTLLGSILRIDVDGGDPYVIPADNPFVGLDHAQPGIWVYGLRNPWKFSFDHETNELYIGDVGQDTWEEINRVPADEGGINFGWKIMEGRDCYAPPSGCDQSGLTPPIAQYDHSRGCSITGGYVYRGSDIPELEGHYFFADYCGGWVRSLVPDGRVPPTQQEWDLGDLGLITSFGQDADGELYILDQTGSIYRIVAAE